MWLAVSPLVHPIKLADQHASAMVAVKHRAE